MLWGGVIVGVFASALVALFVMLSRVERFVAVAPDRLARLACPRCGAIVGPETATEVSTRHKEDMRRLWEDAGKRGLRLRIDPRWRFPCPACGVALAFDPGAEREPLTISDR